MYGGMEIVREVRDVIVQICWGFVLGGGCLIREGKGREGRLVAYRL